MNRRQSGLSLAAQHLGKAGLCGSLAMLGLFHPASEDEPKEVKTEQLRNEAQLPFRFVPGSIMSGRVVCQGSR